MQTPKINHKENRQARLASGGIGFQSDNAVERFDNLVVTPENSNEINSSYTSITEDKDKKDGTSFITIVQKPGIPKENPPDKKTTEDTNALKDKSYSITVKEASNKFVSTPKNKYIILKSPIKIGKLTLKTYDINLKIQGNQTKKLFDIKDIQGLSFELGKPQSNIIKIDACRVYR